MSAMYFGLLKKAASGPPPAGSYTVSGAGSTEWNGVYVPNGNNSGGLPLFTKDATHHLARGAGGDIWFLMEGTDYTGSASYQASNINDTPPANGWSSLNGNDPAPTLTAN